MRTVYIASSLLLTFSISMFGLGCDSGKKPGTTPPVKPATPGSTTGGGTEVPAAGGTTEKVEAKPEEKPAESKPEEKTEEKATEAKPEEKAEEK